MNYFYFSGLGYLGLLSFLCLLNACGGGSKTSSYASTSSAAGSSSSVEASYSSSSTATTQQLADKVIEHTIEHVTSILPTGTHRDSGTLRSHFGSNGTFLGDNLLLSQSRMVGSYSVKYAGNNIQVTTQPVGSSKVIVDTYIFLNAASGRWEQNYDNGSIILQGSFTLREEAYPGYAVLQLAGYRASLTFTKTTTNLPAGTYIDSGTAFHIYATPVEFATDLSNYGLPSGVGTYTYTRPAPNVGVDSGFNITFNAPYRIEYEFETLTSGVFKENWNNGEILWEGTFVLTPIE